MSQPTHASASPAVVMLLGAIMAFGPLSIDMYLPAMPALAEALAASSAQVQWTLSAYLVGLAIGQLLYGPASDRFGRRRPLLLGVAVFTLASLACAAAQSIDALVLLRCLQALGGAAGMVIVRAVVRDLYSLQAAARVLSLLILIMGVAPILAPLIGGQILLWLDWRWIFVTLALLGLGCLGAIVKLLPETLDAQLMRGNRARPWRTIASDYREVLRNRQFLGFALTGASGLAALFAYISCAAFVLIEELGVAPQAFGIWFGINAAAFILGSQCSGRLLRRFHPRQMLPWTVTLFVAGSLLLLVWTLLPGFSVGRFVIAVSSLMFAVGATLANTTALAMHPFSRQAGAASAMLGSLQLGCGAIAGLLVSWSYGGSAVPLALVVCGCALLGSAALRGGLAALRAEDASR